MKSASSTDRNAKNNARQRRYAARHRKQELERHQAWRDANREHIRQWYRDYYAKNKASILAAQKRRQALKGKKA